ncbi:hypothetical protein KF946_03975 [Idiomarina loihiensis]|uniref:hypothetical protein n=1 Tax=Idiomarina loihiensis TaxID=135577 RepID=UPI00129C82AB|nr:hypothetical protein [Idiomarina loihiensis]MRJ44134.1 hypothetical protein [Idiomarina loihiensis]UTW33745.1 hypothetical protein KF946_03975 [Idiomarina loihiensis]
MGLIEAILIGFQFKRLEKPLVFVTMLVALLCFVAMGVVIVLAAIEALLSGKGLLPAIGIVFLSSIFFGLSAVCGHFVKRSVQ